MYVQKLQVEIPMASGSLSDDIDTEIKYNSKVYNVFGQSVPYSYIIWRPIIEFTHSI